MRALQRPLPADGRVPDRSTARAYGRRANEMPGLNKSVSWSTHERSALEVRACGRQTRVRCTRRPGDGSKNLTLIRHPYNYTRPATAVSDCLPPSGPVRPFQVFLAICRFKSASTSERNSNPLYQRQMPGMESNRRQPERHALCTLERFISSRRRARRTITALRQRRRRRRPRCQKPVFRRRSRCSSPTPSLHLKADRISVRLRVLSILVAFFSKPTAINSRLPIAALRIYRPRNPSLSPLSCNYFERNKKIRLINAFGL